MPSAVIERRTTNLFYGTSYPRQVMDRTTQYLYDLRPFDLTELGLETMFESIHFSNPLSLKYSGSKAWGVQIARLPKDWTKEATDEIPTRQIARGVLKSYQSFADLGPMFPAELEVEGEEDLTKLTKAYYRTTDISGGMVRVGFASFNSEAIRAVETLIGARGESADWFCCDRAVKNSAVPAKKIFYLSDNENRDLIKGSECLGWVTAV